MQHYVGGAPMPFELLSLLMCRDVYHCPPDVFRQQRWRDVAAHLTCLEIEAEYRRVRHG